MYVLKPPSQEVFWIFRDLGYQPSQFGKRFELNRQIENSTFVGKKCSFVGIFFWL